MNVAEDVHGLFSKKKKITIQNKSTPEMPTYLLWLRFKVVDFLHTDYLDAERKQTPDTAVITIPQTFFFERIENLKLKVQIHLSPTTACFSLVFNAEITSCT